MLITSENIVSKLTDIVKKTSKLVHLLNAALIEIKCKNHEINKIVTGLLLLTKTAENINIDDLIVKENYEMCDCGSRMDIMAELSELICPDCGNTRNIIGVVFRDDQFYPQEGQKTKHSGYDTSRHYRFHMERLQALENKTFPDKTIKNIEYIINRDKYNRTCLTCDQMREILKDPVVNEPKLNYHAPLLVKLFGGVPPVQLDFTESKKMRSLFNRTMQIYETISPADGNKPYYPFFIYKIIEQIFAKSPKISLLNFIHLQSRETVIKNDIYFKQICAIIADDKVLKYTPTNVRF